MSLAPGWSQIADLPDVFAVGGASGYSSFTTAYNACVTKSYNTCEVWDYNLTTTPETFSLSPFNFGVATVPIDAHLGPGTITLLGPLVVPQNSVITGAGRSQSSIAAGTVLQAGTNFGGVGYVTWTGGTGGCSGSGALTFNGVTTSAMASWSTAGGTFAVTMINPGGSYGTTGTPPTVSFSGSGPTGCLTGVTGLTAHLTGSMVIIGDSNQGIGASDFGSRLVNLTIDCKQKANCTALEMQNAQEQCGPVNVNGVNYTSRCLWVHGMSGAVGTDNSGAFDIECNGNYTAASSMTPSTVPVEFDNTKSRGIVKATINPVASNLGIALTSGTSPDTIVCAGSNPWTATVTAASSASIPANWNSTPPYSLSPYVTIAGISPANSPWNNTWPINTITTGTAGSFKITGSGSCPAASNSSTGATATLEPSADIIVCSGSSCAYGAEGAENNPTQVSLVQVHMEHAGTGVFVTGSNTSVNLVSPTTTVGGNSMYASVTIDSGANAPASVNISSLLANSEVQYLVVDGITGVSLPIQGSGNALANYVSGTSLPIQSLFGPAALQPPVMVKTGNYTVTANDNLTTFDNTGASSNFVYTLPNPPVPGMTYTFLDSAATSIGFRLSPGSGVSIQLTANGCGVTPAAGISVSTMTQYSGVTLQAISPIAWRSTSCTGTWTTP